MDPGPSVELLQPLGERVGVHPHPDRLAPRVATPSVPKAVTSSVKVMRDVAPAALTRQSSLPRTEETCGNAVVDSLMAGT